MNKTAIYTRCGGQHFFQEMFSEALLTDGRGPLGKPPKGDAAGDRPPYKKPLEGRKVNFEAEPGPRGAKGVRAANVAAQVEEQAQSERETASRFTGGPSL